MVFKPKFAMDMHLSMSIGALPVVGEVIQVDNTSYSKFGNGKYTTSPATNSSDPNAKASELKIVGEETLGADKAWHVTGKREGQLFEEWVRQSDGYLLQLKSQNDQGASFRFTLDTFNHGAKVVAPALSLIQPAAKNLSGTMGKPLSLNGVDVTVVSVDPNYSSANEFIKPKAGDRFVVAEILYQNTGTDHVSYNPFDWGLTDSQGFSYQPTYGGKEPALNSGELSPGDKVRGFITYEVPTGATGLTLKGKVGNDTASISL